MGLVSALRQKMRDTRNAKRLAKDAAADQLLETDDGKQVYWSNLATDCEKSSLIGLLESVTHLDGDVIECGVFRGASLRLIGKTVKDRAADKTVFACDSFEGFPEGGITDEDTKLFRSEERLMGKFKDIDDVPDRLKRFGETFGIKLDVRKGYFEHTLPDLKDRRFCFIHLDSDTYSSHVECFASLYDNLTPGGIIVYDDYASEAWPGAKKAIDEFLADKPEDVQVSRDRENEAWYSVKPA